MKATFPGVVPNGDTPDNGLGFKIINGGGTPAEHHFMFAARTPVMLAAWMRTVRTFIDAARDIQAKEGEGEGEGGAGGDGSKAAADGGASGSSSNENAANRDGMGGDATPCGRRLKLERRFV